MFARPLFDRSTGATRSEYLLQRRLEGLLELEERARFNEPSLWHVWRCFLNRAVQLHRRACRRRVVPVWILRALDSIEKELRRGAIKETA
jgi:hypothetical protein